MSGQSEKFTTPKFRAAFASLFEARAIGDGKPKYSVTMLFPKKDKTLQKRFQDMITEAVDNEDRFSAKEKATIKKKAIAANIQNGDDKEYDGFPGCFFIKASNSLDRKPKLVDEDVNEIIDREDFWSGCYARATIVAFTWKHPTGGNGVSFSLLSVQKMANGDRFGAGGNPAEDYDIIEREDDLED